MQAKARFAGQDIAERSCLTWPLKTLGMNPARIVTVSYLFSATKVR
jgi:hypothetical protein